MLDLSGVNLNQLATSIATPQQTHYMLCIGPVNPSSQRIDTFWQAFGQPECFVQMEDPQCSRTSRTMHTFGCKLRGFMHQGAINTPAISNNTQTDVMPFDDYDEEQSGRYTPLQLQLQKAFRQILGQQDTLLINPPLDGPTPDLMTISPNRGILIVQSFEGNLRDYAIKRNIRHRQHGQTDITLDTKWLVHKQTQENKPSPFLSLDNCQEHLLDLLADANSYTQQWAREGVTTVKKVAFFTENTQKEVEDFFVGTTRNYIFLQGCELLTDNVAQQTLQRDLRLQENSLFSQDRLKLLLEHLTPSWHARTQGIERELSRQQRELAQSIAGKQQKISGVAGSGKTQVLAMRAVDAMRKTGGRVLILCFNKTLVNYLQQRILEVPADFFVNQLTIGHFHKFMLEQARRCLPLREKRNFYPFDDFSEMQRLFDQRIKEPIRYEAIFIDEVQDFQAAWLQLLRRYFLVDGGEFVVFGDPKQNIYGRPLDKEGNIELGAIIGGLWNKRLSTSHRFTNPRLARLAQDYQRHFLPFGEIGTPPQDDLFDASLIKYANVGTAITVEQLEAYCQRTIEKYQLQPDQTILLSLDNNILQEIEDIRLKNRGLSALTTFVSKRMSSNRIKMTKLKRCSSMKRKTRSV